MQTSISNPRNLVNIGVFSCVYFVVMFASGMLGIFSPAMMFVGWIFGISINGVVVMLYLAKVPQVGALTIMGVVVGLGMLLTGHYWLTLVGLIPLAFVADLIAKSGNFRRPVTNGIAYGLFNMWHIFPLVPIFINADAYFEDVAQVMNSTEYADRMRALFTLPVLSGWAVVVFVLSFVAALIGMRMLGKHFQRAGVV